MYCRNCGAEVPETAKFCAHCGAGLDGYETSPRPGAGTAQEVRPKRKTRIILIILAAVVVAAAIVVVLILTLGGTSQTVYSEPSQARAGETTSTPLPDVETGSWVYDGAGVFSSGTVQALREKNEELSEKYGVHVAVASMPEIKGWDISDFCLNLGDTWGLGGTDFLLVMDIGGDDYCLLQGSELADDFSDEMAYQYLHKYLEADFAGKEYGAGAETLVDALTGWYGSSQGQTALSGSGSQTESGSSYSDSDGYAFGWGR